MTTTVDCASAPADCAQWPSFELTYEVDDPEAPSSVTVFTESAEAWQTEWLTMDFDHTVSIPDAR